MTDEQRSKIMRQVKSRDTGPEKIVRRLLHSLGYRYRLYNKDLPCKPDITFKSRRKIIFVHGCFWHGHSCKRGARTPATNVDYWKKKIARNVERDAACIKELEKDGWAVLVVWECELADKIALSEKLVNFLGKRKQSPAR